MRPIFAFSTRVTPLLSTLWFSTRPSTSSQSSMVPLERKPTTSKYVRTEYASTYILFFAYNPHATSDWTYPSFLMTLMSFRSTPVAVAGSMTCITASTLMGASRLEYSDTTLEQSEVVALFSSVSRSPSCTGRLMDVKTSTPLSTAFWKDSEMMVGWIPSCQAHHKYI